jgi:hypothetical protein
LKYGADKAWGFLTMTIDGQTINGKSTEIDRNGNVNSADAFSYPAAPVVLQNPRGVPALRNVYRSEAATDQPIGDRIDESQLRRYSELMEDFRRENESKKAAQAQALSAPESGEQVIDNR